MQFENLTGRMIERLAQALRPWFTGQTETALIQFGDRVVGSALEQITPRIDNLQDGLAASTGASLVGFQQSGTGAVARTMLDKARERFSLLDFMSDAERADVMLASPLLDHTASVQKAANEIVARGGGVLDFPAKATLRVNNIQIVGSSGAWLSGVKINGNGCRIVANPVAKSNAIIFSQYVNGLDISGLEVDGNYSNMTAISTGVNHAFGLRDCKNVRIHGNHIHHTGRGTNPTDQQGDALYLAYGPCENVSFYGNTISSWGRWVVAATGPCSGLFVLDNVCTSYVADGDRALGFVDLETNAGGQPITGVQISGNVVYRFVGIAVSASMDAVASVRSDISITNNQLLGHYTDDDTAYWTPAYAYGVRIEHGQKILLSGNRIVLGGGTQQCARVSGTVVEANSVIVTGNYLEHKGSGAAFIAKNVDGLMFVSNYCKAPASGGRAVEFLSTCKNVSVIGNSVYGSNSSYNSQYELSEKSSISGNYFSGGSQARVICSSDLSVSGNSGPAPLALVNLGGTSNIYAGGNTNPPQVDVAITPVAGLKGIFPYLYRSVLQSSAAPTTGTWVRGDVVFNINPSAGGNSGWICTTAGTPGTWSPFGYAITQLSGSKTHDWPDLPTATQQTTTVTVTGAVLGDYAEASMSVDLAGTALRAYVSAADTVTVVQRNDTGANVNLASGTLRVRVRKP